MKKLCSAALAAALLFSAALPLPAGAVSGQEAGAQAAQTWTPVTRGQAVQQFYEAMGKPGASSACPFPDVPEAYRTAVAWAAERGYVSGAGAGQFLPEEPITRQALAAILYQAAGSPDLPSAAAWDDGGLAGWADWAREAGRWCALVGLSLSGSPEGTLSQQALEKILHYFVRLPHPDDLLEDVEALTQYARPIGSRGEEAAARYLEERFAGMGYSVTTQTYTDGQGQTGTNVIAVKKAAGDDPDILVLSAHHDSFPTTWGASDNASGVAALLAVAEALEGVPSDTEVRFLSFTDEENGKNGSRYYAQSLSQEERERIIGDIQFDMLGGLGSGGVELCTMDGTANWISGLLQQRAPTFSLAGQTASDHASFQLAGIPSVLVTQDGQGYLYHSAGDTADQLNLWAIAGAVACVTEGAEEILSQDTPSYRALARAEGDGYTYRQTRQTTIYFGASQSETEAYIGAAGTPDRQWEVSGEGWSDAYESIRYSMRWFGLEEPLNTYYIYRNGYLDHIEIRPEETGCSAQAAQEAVEAMYGAPAYQDEASVNWEDPIYSKYLSLSRDDSGCLISVVGYSLGMSNQLSFYAVTDGQAQIANPQDARVWELVCRILPQEARQSIARFSLFTDGASNILAYTSPLQREDGSYDNSRFELSIDYYDVYDEEGQPRDWSKLIYTILHEYGHVLLEDDSQIDLTVGADTHDPAGFREGSFRKAFYDAFWAGLGDSAVSDYEEHPTRYVSRYGANYFHEDIADTFAVFVLGGEPQGNTVAAEKLRFFAQDEDMAALRSAIRANLGL